MKTILSVLSCLLLFACAPSVDTAKWTEEVLQPDGSVIQVTREAQRISSGFADSSRVRYLMSSLTYEPLGVSWPDRGSGEPLTFEILEGRVYLVLASAYACDETTPPGSFAVRIFQWENNGWARRQQTEVPIAALHLNLLQRYWGNSAKDDATGLVRFERKLLFAGEEPAVPLVKYLTEHNAFCRVKR